MLVIVLAVALAAVSLLGVLRRHEGRSQEATVLITALEGGVKEERALSDHEVMMDMPMPDLVEQVHSARGELAKTLEELAQLQKGDETVTRLQRALVTYHGAMDEQTRLMAAGQVTQARSLHRETLHPMFESVHGLVVDALTSYEARARRAGWIASWGSGGVLIIVALAVGLLFWKFGRARRAAEVMAAERRALGDRERHFRSLVRCHLHRRSGSHDSLPECLCRAGLRLRARTAQ